MYQEPLSEHINNVTLYIRWPDTLVKVEIQCRTVLHPGLFSGRRAHAQWCYGITWCYLWFGLHPVDRQMDPPPPQPMHTRSPVLSVLITTPFPGCLWWSSSPTRPWAKGSGFSSNMIPTVCCWSPNTGRIVCSLELELGPPWVNTRHLLYSAIQPFFVSSPQSLTISCILSAASNRFMYHILSL